MPSSRACGRELEAYTDDVATSAPSYEETLAHVRIVREIGARTPGTYLGETSDGPNVVLETYANVDARAMRAVAKSAQRLCGVKHPHLVSVLSVERMGVAWSIVTEHVDGAPLEEVFFAMSLGARLRSIVDILTALSALHLPHSQAGPLVHGGCLLRSAFVDKGGRTKLGFAYRGALCIGKDTYAPEALLGDAIDPRTDVYGAGVLLWEAITGRPLFGRDAPEEVVKKQLSGRIEKALPAARDGWAGSLLPVIDRALATDPTARYGTIAEMAAALRIAVRARLVFHDDIVEELWPATTVPEVASGVQPTARATLAAPELETRPESKTRAAPPIESPLAPPRSRVSFGYVIPAAVALAVLIACVVHVVRGAHRVSERPATNASSVTAPPLMPAPTEPSSVDVAETVAPTQAAPTPVTPLRDHPAPHKGRHTTKPPGTYDPSSI